MDSSWYKLVVECVVECSTWNLGVVGLSFTGAIVLCPSLTRALGLLLSTSSTKEDLTQHDWTIVDWIVKNEKQNQKNNYPLLDIGSTKETCPNITEKLLNRTFNCIFIEIRNFTKSKKEGFY